MLDLASFSYGAFAGAFVIVAGEWIWLHFVPVDRSRDAMDLAKKRKQLRYEGRDL